jgi:hypothetical protein
MQSVSWPTDDVIVQILSEVLDWAKDNVGLLSEWAGASLLLWIASLVLTAIAMRYYLIWLPPDAFAKDHQPFDAWRNSHPVIRWTLLIGKNVTGALLIVAGLIMLVTPGPGWLALLIGLALVDMPGKRACERRILRRPAILHLVNRIRAKAGHPVLELTAEQNAPP